MKKFILFVLFILSAAIPSYAATTNTFQSGGVDLNWSTTGNWDQGHVPLADEIVIIPNLVAVMDVERIPATAGKIASLSMTTGGQITIDVSNAICHTACSINVTGDIQAGTKNTGAILTSGDASGHTLVIDAANIIAGTGTNAEGITWASTGTGTLTITGHLKGGSGTSAAGLVIGNGTPAFTISNGAEGGAGSAAYGFENTMASTGTITGNITGGTGTGASGVYNYAATPQVTLNNGHLINGTGAVAWAGRPPAWNPGYGYYLYWYAGASFSQAPNTYFYNDTDPGIANVAAGTTYYFQSASQKTGTLSAGAGGAWGF